MKRMHKMPFGAELEDGLGHFKIWAPAARRVELCLGRAPPAPMNRGPDGFHRLTVPGANAGDRYAFRFDDEPKRFPDPASRFNPGGVGAPSEIVDPGAFDWRDECWTGLPWRDAVFYELHIGTFTPEGTFAAAAQRLEYLVELGVTAIELMPIADGPGQRNWGYDGVLPFAIRPAYGRPEDLKRLVEAAHQANLMIFLDVVYNHFGPSGNYLGHYAPQFFTSRHKTPWGDAINFDGPDSAPVRAFFIHNALYWLEEYRFDGLRLDAVHAIIDDSEPDFLTELAGTVQEAMSGRHIHLVLENGDNEARYLARGAGGQPRLYTAQWNDDLHHAMHVLLTGESAGYYEDYDRPASRLLRCLTEGFAYQGEPSRHWNGRTRGEPSADLPPGAFVSFLQNHDQIGNRAFGERLSMLAEPHALRAAETVLLLLPTPILLFMGEEFHAPNGFPFFCDFEGELADAVREGRRNEFAHFFERAQDLGDIPDPNDERTFASARLDWRALDAPANAEAVRHYRHLLATRRDVLRPLLPAVGPGHGRLVAEQALIVTWSLTEGAVLTLAANLGAHAAEIGAWPDGDVLAASSTLPSPMPKRMPPWHAAWFLQRPKPDAAKPQLDER